MSFLSLIKKSFFALTSIERRSFMVFAAVFVISLIGLVIIILRSTTELVPAIGGSYSEGMVGQPTHINPVLASSHADKALVKILFASISDVAEKIEVSEEGREVRLRLKEGLTWSDGAPLTSDDIIFTIQKIQDPLTSSPLFSAWQGVTPSRRSQIELVFNLASPYAFFAENLSSLQILPKHLYAEVPAPNWRLSDFNLQPVGSGPYTFSSYQKRQNGFIYEYRFIKNSRYAGTEPLIQAFNVLFFPNEDELLSAFNSGRVDGFATIDPTILSEVKRPYSLVEFPSPTVYAVFWNQSQNLAIQSQAVRNALSIAIERDELIEQVLLGHGVTAYYPLPPTLPSIQISFNSPTSTIAEAKSLLDANGWNINEEGILEKRTKDVSVPLSFELVVPDIPFLLSTARYIELQWQLLGADVNLVVIPPGPELDSIIRNRAYQSILFGNSVRASGDLFSFWHSSERFFPGLNLALYQNSSVDALIEFVRQNFNENERAESMLQILNSIESESPALFLYAPSYLYATNTGTRGIEGKFIQDIADRFIGVEMWHLKTARVLK